MARTRKALNPNSGSGFYHVISRVVGGEFLLEEEEKGVFTSLMRKTAAFCGIEIVTHVVMSKAESAPKPCSLLNPTNLPGGWAEPARCK